MAIALRYAARSNVGLGVKSRNEDSAYAGPHLLVLADGMGGHAAGDVASSLVVGELVHLDGESHGGDDSLQLLAGSLHAANLGLREAMEGNAELDGMGTTVVAMLRTGSKMALANIGDSRGYLLREGGLRRLTRDHTLVQALVEDGRVAAEDAETHPRRSLLMKALQTAGSGDPDIWTFKAKPGDRYLLCSDGLSGPVSEATLRDVLDGGAEPAEVIPELIRLANEGGGPDNITCVVADVTA